MIGGEYAFVVRAAEDREGREVLLGVAALRGGVDEDGPLRRPHDVAAPQVAVGAGGADAVVAVSRVFYEARLPVVERARFEAFAELVDERSFRGREGTVVDADDLMDEMVATARAIAEEQGKGKDMPAEEAAEVARRVGLGSLKYFILKVDPRKNMTFNPKESIDFNGNTGSFIQYTYARIRSLLRKAEELGIALPATFAGLTISTKEQELIAKVAEYADVVEEAARTYSPAVIANYVYDLVKEYNQFYHEFSILKEENEELRAFRLALSEVVARTIAAGFSLLGIEMPERM